MAIDEMANLLMYHLELDDVDAAMLISAAVDTRFSYVGGPPLSCQSCGIALVAEDIAIGCPVAGSSSPSTGRFSPTADERGA